MNNSVEIANAGIGLEQFSNVKYTAEVSTESPDNHCNKASKAVTSWTIFASALANFSDGYQNNLASSTNVIFTHTFPQQYTSSIQTRISNALLIGAVIGIVVLGYVCDIWSRKGGLWFTSTLVVVGSLMATLAFQVHEVNNLLWYITIARGITGFGVGGEYPSSASAALEGSNEHFDSNRGPIQVIVSTLQATSAGPICALIYLLALIGSNNDLIVAFHTIYAVAIFLPLAVVILRFRMSDGLLFRKGHFRNPSRIPYRLILKRYGWRLFGTSAAFFLYDFINFPNSIMSSTIINEIVPDKNIRVTAVWQLILALLAVPGVILGSWLCNKIGRRWTGIAGWAGYIILGFIVGGCYDILTQRSLPAFIVLYGIMQSLGHMGPGATIGLMSVELFPTAIRGMAYGVSAGFGKAGAAIGTEAFTPLRTNAGPSSTFYLAGGIAVIGLSIYFFLPEGKDLDLASEDKDFIKYLQSEGWAGELSS